MKKFITAILLLFATTCFAGPSATASLAPMLKRVTPAIVNISVRGQLPPLNLPFLLPKQLKPSQRSPKFAGIGSGVIVDAEHGYIITNAHVIKNAKVIIITLHDGRRVHGKLVGLDVKSDIAVLRVRSKHLSAIKLGDSSNLQVGDFVAAIGNPFGIGQTVTSGVVSGLGRSNLGIEGYENFIQTDAPINPGNSGGALVNTKGELVGINTAIITPYRVGANVGIGLAIPSNMCKAVMEQIIKYGKVEHSLMGVIVQSVTPALADALQLSSSEGALVADVSPGTPAAEAGLKVKDVILTLNGHKVTNAFQISTDIGLLRPGTQVTLKIHRNGKTITLHATTMDLKKAKKLMAATKQSLLSDVSLRNFSQLVNNRLVKGVQIIRIGVFSYAYSCGLRPGDVIVAAAGKSVANVNQLKELVKQNPDSVLLKVKPRGKTSNIFLVLEK